VAAARGYEYIDFRAAMLAWEIANNTPAPGTNGVGTLNDTFFLHPTPTTAAAVMGAAAFAHFTIQ
jgi:hypothetical protein